MYKASEIEVLTTNPKAKAVQLNFSGNFYPIPFYGLLAFTKDYRDQLILFITVKRTIL